MAYVVNSNPPLVEYTAAPGQTVYTFDFLVPAAADLKVEVGGAPKVNGTDYAVTGAGDPDGGSISYFGSPILGGETVKLYRSIQIQRTTNFPLSGPFEVERLNEELGTIIMALQEQALLPVQAAESAQAALSALAQVQALINTWDGDADARMALIDAAVVAAQAAAEDAATALDTFLASAGRSAHHESRAALAAATIPAAVSYVQLAGYAAAGDGGAALHKRIAAPGAPKSWQLQSADGAWWELAEKSPTALMFGAKADAVTDDTAAIQAGIDYLVTRAYGGKLIFPGGRYKVSAPLTVTGQYITLMGEANNSAELVRAAGFTTGYTVDFSRGGGASTIYWGAVKNLRFTSTDAMTSGAHLRLNVARLFELDNLYLDDGFIGIEAVSVGDLTVSNTTIVTGTKYPTGGEAFAYFYFGTDTAAGIPRNGAYLENCNFRSKDDDAGHALHGIYISSADGIWMDSVHIGNCNSSCVSAIPSDGTTQLSGLKFDNCWFDQGGTGRGFNAAGTTTAPFGYFHFTDCFFMGLLTAARLVPTSGKIRHVFFEGCFMANITSSAMQFQDAEDFAVRGCTIRNAGSGGGSVHGIHVIAGCSQYTISGCQVGYNEPLTANALTGYGIVLNGTNYICEGNNCLGNTTGGILDSGTGTRLIRNNLGANGTGTIASAAAISLPADGDLFTISGTTSITSVTASWAGRRVTLVFSGALTFTDGSNLKLATSYVTTPDDTISLVCDGTNWFETSRSAN